MENDNNWGDAKFTEQDSNNTGKWDCSGFAAYVQGISQGKSSEDILASGTDIDWTLTGQAMKEHLPTGTAIAKLKHVMVVLGHTSSGCLLADATGSDYFLNAKVKTYSTLQSRNYTKALLP